MLILTLITLIVIAAIATGLSLLDSWLRGRVAFRVLRHERALLKAGFVPQIPTQHVRLRKPVRRGLASATRPYSSRIPQSKTPLPAIELAG